MKKTRAEYELWLRDSFRKRRPDIEAPLLAACDAIDTIQEEKRLDATLLATIVEAASSSRRPVYENATGFLGKLTAEYSLARDSVERMAADARSHVRLNAILCLEKTTPLKFTLRLIRQGLRDKSAKVRQKAADWSFRLRLRDVVEDLEAAFAAEQNTKAKQEIEFALRLLRDGYILKEEDDGSLCVTAITLKGCGSRWFERSEIEQRGFEAIVAEFASDPLISWPTCQERAH